MTEDDDRDPFELCRRFGIQVILASGLPRSALYMREYGIALISSDLDDAGRRWVADRLLSAVACPGLPLC